MKALDLFVLDFKEARRRFLLVAAGFPDELLGWRPDANALSVGETIRHVLLHDFFWLKIFTEKTLPTDDQIEGLMGEPYTNLQKELDMSAIYHEQFLEFLSTLDSNDFDTTYIEWPHKPIRRTLGDTLERKSYHDAVHTGQLLQYMRMLHVERPLIWD